MTMQADFRAVGDAPAKASAQAARLGVEPVPIDRARLALLVRIAASAGDFSPKLSASVASATDAEVVVMSDLVDRGLSIPDLVKVLQGAHIVVGDEELYSRWIFPHSRQRLSSHHRTVDKEQHPDYGLDGPLVRESLHGKAAVGTWMQLERTKATFQWGKLPSWHDVLHIRDFFIYRITGKNVGPWGLSANVDTRPIVLRSSNSTTGHGAENALAAFATRRHVMTESAAEARELSALLTAEVAPTGPAGALFGPQDPVDPLDLLPAAPFLEEMGLGLFGSLQLVRVRRRLSPAVGLLLDAAEPPAVVATRDDRDIVRTLEFAGRRVEAAAAILPEAAPHPIFLDTEAEPMTAMSEQATTAAVGDDQLEDLAELVETGPIDLGAYTQAELAVVLGEMSVFAQTPDEVMVEAVRSLVARGVLYRVPGSNAVEVVGDLGLVVALVTASRAVVEVRRGHSGPADEPWRWLISLLPHGMAGIDRVDALGVHRLMLMSVAGLASAISERLIGGRAKVPAELRDPVDVPADEVARVAGAAPERWQVVLRRPGADGSLLVQESLVLRSGPSRVDLVTKRPDGHYQRVAVNEDVLRDFLVALVTDS